jgi:hypothetical protein
VPVQRVFGWLQQPSRHGFRLSKELGEARVKLAEQTDPPVGRFPARRIRIAEHRQHRLRGQHTQPLDKIATVCPGWNPPK